MILPLQSLRFIFALFIFLHHFQLFRAGGASGVSFFMILSEFVMAAGYGGKVSGENFGYKKYMLKRIIRVYPLHLLCLAAFVAWHIASLTLCQYVALAPNALLLQAWIPDRSFYFSGNAVSWCLSDMLFFYAVFPPLAKIMQKDARKTARCLLGIAAIYLAACAFIPEKYAHPFIYINPLARLLDFAMGILLYYLTIGPAGCRLKIAAGKMGCAQKTLVEIFAFAPLALAVLAYPYAPPAFRLAPLFWLPSCIVIATFALLDNAGGALSCALKNKYLVKAGAFSFTFYMIHQMFINAFNSMLGKLGIALAGWEKLPLCLICAIALSYTVYRFIELPAAERLKAYIK